MKFIRGKENQIINLEFVEIIDIVEGNGKFEIQAKMADFSIVLNSFEHIDHAKEFLENLWKDLFPLTQNLLEAQNQLAV